MFVERDQVAATLQGLPRFALCRSRSASDCSHPVGGPQRVDLEVLVAQFARDRERTIGVGGRLRPEGRVEVDMAVGRDQRPSLAMTVAELDGELRAPVRGPAATARWLGDGPVPPRSRHGRAAAAPPSPRRSRRCSAASRIAAPGRRRPRGPRNNPSSSSPRARNAARRVGPGPASSAARANSASASGVARRASRRDASLMQVLCRPFSRAPAWTR